MINKFLLELGAGFAFVGKQYKLNVGGDEFRIDLLFYHIKIKSYVVVELKAVEFKPEFAGKLSFYTSAIDGEVKLEDDNPTIGILICKSKNDIVVEYAIIFERDRTLARHVVYIVNYLFERTVSKIKSGPCTFICIVVWHVQPENI